MLGRNRKHRLKKVGILTVVIFLTAGSLWYFCIIRPDHKEMLPDNIKEENAFQIDSGDIVTATGVTEIGIDAVTFAIDFLEDTRLYVEDVYLSNGDTVVAGEAYIKFTDDSIEKARAELEKAVQNTERDYRSKIISNGEDKIQAKYTYDTTVLEAGFAPQVYQDTLTQLEMQLVKAEKACEEAQEEYNEYYESIVNNTFYEDYQIEKLKKAYDDAYDLYVSRRAYWEVTPEELNALSDRNTVQKGQNDRQWIVRTVALLREEMTEAQEEYEQAKQDYQREIEGAELKLQRLLNQLERAQQDLVDAQLERESGSLCARTSYELAVARGQLAESDYHVCLMSLDDELEHLKDARDKAVENRALFEELIGDGYLYTEREGTVLMVQADKGQALAGGDLILAYANAGEISVSVTATKIDTAKLFVGEKASVTVGDGSSFDGTVETICPIVTTDNKMSVYNLVMVSLNGDVSAIEPDRPASVVFGGNAQDDMIQCSADGYSVAEHGMVSQMYDLDIYGSDILAEANDQGAEYLKVEELYVEEGQHIREGDLVCQLTQDSMERVRKALADTQSEASIALARAQVDYHIGVLEAGLSHNEAVVGRTLAQTAYDNTIAKLNSGMVAKILETEQLLADIYQMQTTLTDNDHQEKRADITRAYEQARQQVEKSRESYVTNQVEAAQNFQTAKESYEQFLNQLEASSQQIADKAAKVYALQEEILQSQQLMETELLAAEQTRISAQTEGKIASAKYAGALKEYKTAVEKAQSDFDQAADRLDAFNQFVGDGTVYATGNGLVTEVGYSKGDWLIDTGKLLSFAADINRLMEEKDTQ